MKGTIKRVLILIAMFAFGFFVVGPLAMQLAKADGRTPTPDQPFAFKCDGPNFQQTADGCAQRLMDLCPNGVELAKVVATPPDVTPARITGVARCAALKGVST